jgi:hypothetical protein
VPLRVCTGFEHGVSDATSLSKGNTGVKLFDGAGGSPTMVTTPSVRTGTYALQTNPSAAIERVFWNTTGGTIPASQNRAVVHFAIRFNGALPSEDVRISMTETATGDAGVWFRNSDDKLVATAQNDLASGTLGVGPVVVADTWYVVEYSMVCSANPHTVDWEVDGAAQAQASGAIATATIVQINIGPNLAHTCDLLFDDVAVWTDTAAISTYPHGPLKVVLLIPDTGGSTAEIGTANATGRMVTNSAIDATHNSADILAALSEVPPLIGASATGVGQRTSGTGNAVGIPMTTYTLAGGESILGVRILIVGWSATATTNNYGMRTFNGTSETTLFASADPNFDASTTSPAWLCKMATDTDFDTQAELDALVVRLGYSADINPLPGAHAVYAEVAIQEAGGGTVDGDAALTVTATYTATASIAIPATASVTGTATFTATGIISKDATASRAVTATFTATAIVTAAATASRTVTATLTATAVVVRSATATITTTATVTASGGVVVPATSSLTITAAWTATGDVPAVWGPPTNIIATPVSETQIDLAWDAVVGASGYDIERDSVIIATDVVGTTYSDMGLTADTEYGYRLRSVRA